MIGRRERPGGYGAARVEREDVEPSAAGRIATGLVAQLTSRLHARADALLSTDALVWAARMQGKPLLPEMPVVTAELRRGGWTRDAGARAFGLYAAALIEQDQPAPGAAVFRAAGLLVRGGVAALAERSERDAALGLAMFARAMLDASVHVMGADDAQAHGLAARLGPSLQRLGVTFAQVLSDTGLAGRQAGWAAPVVFCSVRESVTDYLRDGMRKRGAPGLIRRRLNRLSGIDADADAVLHKGLHCALIDDADFTMLDDATAPFVLSAEADIALQRLVHEQALELARALGRDAWLANESDMELSDAGRAQLEQLARPLGGLWHSARAREQLVELALHALHVCQGGRHYRVQQGRVIWPPGPDAQQPDESEQTRRWLVELKEGCPLSVRRELVARLSAPRFLRRYLHLGGICAQAATNADFRPLYGLESCGFSSEAHPPPPLNARLFPSGAARMLALVDAIRECVSNGASAVVAMRTPPGVQAVLDALQAAELQVSAFTANDDAACRQMAATLGAPGRVAVLLYPSGRQFERDAPDGPPVHLFIGELHDAARHCERLADGLRALSCNCLLAIDDPQPAALAAPWQAWLVRRWLATAGGAADDGRALPASLFAWVQAAAERSAAALREDVVASDRQVNELLAFAGRTD